MNRSIPLLLCAAALVGCVGEAEWALAPSDPTGPVEPSGPAPVKVSTFQGMSQGLPTSATLAGTAQANGILYAVASSGLYSLTTGGAAWVAVTLPVQTGESPTSVTRIGNSIYVTSSDGAGHGGLYALTVGDDTFTRVAGAPSAESYAIVKKGSELLLTTSGALMASADGSVWTTRSGDALFAKPVDVLVAAAAATRIFALVDGVLHHSDDSGATWSQGLVSGSVTAVQATGAYVLVQTASGTVRSENYGNTFHPVDVGGAAQAFALSGDRAFAGTGTGLRVSDDGGATWRDSGDGLPAGGAVNQLFLSGAALVASTGGAVYLAQIQ